MDKGDALISKISNEDIQNALRYIRQEGGDSAVNDALYSLQTRVGILEDQMADMKEKASDAMQALVDNGDAEITDEAIVTEPEGKVTASE